MFMGVFIGANAALPMYLWQSNAQVAVACFVIVMYTSWLVAATWREIVVNYTVKQELHMLPINRVDRRLLRMLLDPGFWWSLIFGGATITGAVWYAGFQQMMFLTVAGVMWSLIAFLLNFGLTLMQPTTCCRRCGYSLVSHMDSKNSEQVICCPECGTKWSKGQLSLMKPIGPAKNKAA